MSKKHRRVKIDFNLFLTASDMEKIRDAIDLYSDDVYEIDTAPPPGIIHSALFSANAKIQNMTFTDERTEDFPLSDMEFIAACWAVNYIIWLYAAGEIEPDMVPDPLQNRDAITLLGSYLSDKASLVGFSIPTDF